MAERRSTRLDQPRETRSGWRRPRSKDNSDTFGKFAESFARFMGTAQFLVGMTVFIIVWILWNLVGPPPARFDPKWFILLNLIFSTQASYAAPLILLAQNRQDDRDRVTLEQDRARDERNLADTEFITREVASLRFAMREMATRDYVRSELRDLLADLLEELDARLPNSPPDGGAADAASEAAKAAGPDGGPKGSTGPPS